MAKNILIVTPKLTTWGGVSAFWNAILPRWSNYEDISIYKLEVGGHGKNILGAILDQWKFNKCMKQNYDLVFLNPSLGSRSFVRDALFAKQCIVKDVPFVVFFHAWSLDFEQKVDNKYSGFFLKTFGHAKKIFVLSEDFKRKIMEWGYNGEVIVEITTIDTALLGGFSMDAKIEDYKQSPTIKILFLARLIKEKGIFETIDAFQNISKKYDNLELTIAGDGKDFDVISALVVKDNNITITGYVEDKSKIELLQNSHIYCLPSYTEGLPISVLEAMAFGMPIVTTSVGGLKQFFKDKEMGYFVEVKNTKQLEEKLELLINDKKQMISIGTYNANYIKESLLCTTVEKRLYNYMLEVINGE